MTMMTTTESQRLSHKEAADEMPIPGLEILYGWFRPFTAAVTRAIASAAMNPYLTPVVAETVAEAVSDSFTHDGLTI